MIVNKYNNGSGGGSGERGPQGYQGPEGPQGATGAQGPAGSGSSVDSGAVQTQIDNSINSFSEDLQNGDPIVGMAKQLYSPDGVTSEGTFSYRTTAGDADVATGDAELRVLKGNSDYSNVISGEQERFSLMRNGGEVEGFNVSTVTGLVWTSVEKNASIPDGAVIVREEEIHQSGYFGVDFTSAFTSYRGGVSVQSNHTSDNMTQIDSNHFVWSSSDSELIVTATFENGYCIFEVTTGQKAIDKCTFFAWGTDYPMSCDYGVVYEDDIPLGESTYTYGVDGWSPELPQSITAITLNSSTYEPSLGDEIVITRGAVLEGSAVYPTPTSFVALGLNSFDYFCEGILTTKDDDCKVYYDAEDNDGKWGGGTGQTGYTTFYVKAVTGLENGYVIHSPNGVLEFGVGLSPADNFEDADNLDYSGMVEVSANTTYVVYPTTAMPYVVFSVAEGDEEDICVHPRWSGKMDEGFEEYTESVIDLSTLTNDCPLYSVGEYRNEIDLKNGVFKQYVTAEAFDNDTLAQYINDGKVLGTDIEYDENYIYVASSEPTTSSISADYAYKDNDFSVEYFDEGGEIMPQPAFVETYYITNLVDKLRRMENYFIHLESLNTTGDVGKTYEYEGRIMKWVEGSGYIAEWLKTPDQLRNYEGTGLIYAFIPDGQKLFEFKYQYGGDWRYVIYSGGTLYCTETGGTLVASATTDQSFTFQTTQYGNIYQMKGIVKNGYIGFFKNGTISCQNVWSGNVANSHYELIDKYNYPYVEGGSDSSVVSFNDKGQVVSKVYSVGRKAIYFNTTGYSSLGVLTDGSNNAPDRIFVPTTGGDAGQTLVSTGNNSAPTWETRIKVVKITSDAYDALVQAGTTDANTLYALVD